MSPSYRRVIVAMSLAVATLIAQTRSISAQGTCVAPLPIPPHQGGGAFASTIFGVQADISLNNPVFACQNRFDSYTTEWVMIVGPGSSAWIQSGWNRNFTNATVHFWYQSIGPPPTNWRKDRDFDPAQFPVAHVRTYKIEAISDPGGSTTWLLWADDILLDTIPAANLGWPGSGQYGVDMQWSGEVSYVESNMGGPYTDPAHIGFLMWTLGGSWQDVTTPRTFDSWHPHYAGDTHQFPDQTWLFRNWSWYRAFLPLILR